MTAAITTTPDCRRLLTSIASALTGSMFWHHAFANSGTVLLLENALDQIWWWPIRETWFVNRRNEHQNRFMAAR